MALALAISALPLLTAAKLPKPDHIAMPPTPQQTALVKEGVQLHDSRNYEAAIAKYKQVLAENPWEVNALYELAFSYFESKKHEDALATARQGARAKSKFLPQFYMMIGSALDDLGKRDEAIETYKAAIKQNPEFGLLQYNLAVSLRRAGKQAEAKAAAEKALEHEPRHASSNLVLGAVYREMGYRIPAIMAYSCFLAIESESPRAQEAIPVLERLLAGGVSQGSEPNHITINLTGPSKKKGDEGDFTGAEMMMSILVASEMIVKPEAKKEKPASAYERLVSLYSSLGESLDASPPKGGFAAVHYAPYFAALAQAGHTEAFVAHVWRSRQVEGAAEWTKANPAKLEAFLEWSKMFPWRAQ